MQRVQSVQRAWQARLACLFSPFAEETLTLASCRPLVSETPAPPPPPHSTAAPHWTASLEQADNVLRWASLGATSLGLMIIAWAVALSLFG